MCYFLGEFYLFLVLWFEIVSVTYCALESGHICILGNETEWIWNSNIRNEAKLPEKVLKAALLWNEKTISYLNGENTSSQGYTVYSFTLIFSFGCNPTVANVCWRSLRTDTRDGNWGHTKANFRWVICVDSPYSENILILSIYFPIIINTT